MACVCFYSGHTVCVMYEQVEVLSVAFEPDDDVHMRLRAATMHRGGVPEMNI